MSLLNKARQRLTSARETAGQLTEHLSDEVRGHTAIAKRRISDAMAPAAENDLASVTEHLLGHEMNRLILSDAIAGAEADADKDASWDEILQAALLDVQKNLKS